MEKQTKEKENNILKLAILGDYYVGKTSIIKRYTEGIIVQDYIAINHPVYSKKILKIENKNIQLSI